MNLQLAMVISRIGNTHFFADLLQALGERVPFDIAEIYTLSPQSMCGIEFCQRNPGFMVTFPGYENSYLEDPMYRAFQDNLPAGLYRPSELEARYPQTRTYSKYKLLPVGEELEYLVPIETDLALVIWLSRSACSPAFRATSIAELVRFQAPIIAAVQKHVSLTSPQTSSPRPFPDPAPLPFHEALSVGTNQSLTFREIQIVESMLSGKSAKATARQFGIAEGTVRIHRKNIFRKLNIHSQTQLFSVASHPSLAKLVQRAEMRRR